MPNLKGKDVLNIEQLSVDDIESILRGADAYAGQLADGKTLELAKGKVLATLFYEPSTRTRLSFESAMVRLGGQVLSMADAKASSSAAKGETLYDTGKMIESYADVAVIRHPLQGSSHELADGASIPVINGGDGSGQHPTQTLTDLQTIRLECGRLHDLMITLAGDLKNGRTVHSLAPALAQFDTDFYFVSPSSLKMPAQITERLQAQGIQITEATDLKTAMSKSDVLYMTRIQKERFDNLVEYEDVAGSYVLDRSLLGKVGREIIIMHPLPRIDEIAREVDSYEGAAYFRQAANGVPVRMALLAQILGLVY